MYEPQNTPVINALKRYVNEGVIRFHMPGHKGAGISGNPLGDWLGGGVFQADVTNVPGLDDLHQTQGIIKEAQSMAARTFGADSTYFLVNGSSCGLQALVMTVCGPGEKILVPRNMHRSILSGIILSGAHPIYFIPEYDDRYGIPLGMEPDTIALALERHPGVKAVMLVNPTYHGITSNIPRIVEIVHSYKIPLLVDEAHGPHFHFHSGLPPAALTGGADAAVQGTHKMLSAFTQASMLHLKGGLINRQRLEANLRLLQSTSTSYLLLASLDAARAQMALAGRELLQQALELAGYLRENLGGLPGLAVLGSEMIGRRGIYGLDPTKVTVSVRELGVTGFWSERWLRERHRIQVEMSDMYNLLLIITCGNRPGEAYGFIRALRDMGDYIKENGSQARIYGKDWQHYVPGIPEMAVLPREAFFAPAVSLPLEAARGSISAEVIACYPPGIPVLCPGERITAQVVEYVEHMRRVGAHFQGCSDPQLKTLRVIQ